MSLSGSVGKRLAPRITEIAPGLTTSFVREALNRAIDGVGPLPGAAAAADKQLKEQHGNVDRAIHELIENHVRYAGTQGFLTNVGGLVTAAFTIPANITGLTLMQCRMIAGIAHLRGHDLGDPRVRNAILTTLLGEEVVTRLVQKQKLPAPPMALATAPATTPTSTPSSAPRLLRTSSPGWLASASPPPWADGCRSSVGSSAWAPTAMPPGRSGGTPTARSCPGAAASWSAPAPAHDAVDPKRRAS
jgi:hypothetical protein